MSIPEHESIQKTNSMLSYELVNGLRVTKTRWLEFEDGTIYDMRHALTGGRVNAGRLVKQEDTSTARAVFLCAAPSDVEAARLAYMVGPAGEVFRKEYLEPCGLTRAEVSVVAVAPVYVTDEYGNSRPPVPEEAAEWAPHVEAALSRRPESAPVIALGRAAKEYYPDCDLSMPHPAGIQKYTSTRETVRRKVRKMRKILTTDLPSGKSRKDFDLPPECMRGSVFRPRVLKSAEADAEGIVSSVVLEPGTKDAQGDVITSEEIWKAIVWFMGNPSHSKVGYRHQRDTDAFVVENFQARQDMDWLGESVKKGSWVMTAKVNSPEDKQAVMDYFLNAFSIDGIGKRTPVYK